ncbi:MAG: hypothetical protein V3W09_03800 [Nitrososphaerales archaeon]
MDELLKREFGVALDSLDGEAAKRITDRIGSENFERLTKTARDLGKIRDKAEGRRRFLFPPVFSWGRKFSRITEDADQVLKSMGTYLVDAEGKVKGIEYKLRKR